MPSRCRAPGSVLWVPRMPVAAATAQHLLPSAVAITRPAVPLTAVWRVPAALLVGPRESHVRV
eukprot:6133635-Prymnesium_polylepis.5